MTRVLRVFWLGGLLLVLGACRDKKPENLAPAASALAPVAPAAGKSQAFAIDANGIEKSIIHPSA